MRPSVEGLGDFRLADVLAFLAVRRCGSVTAASRELKVSPSQVSKSVARLEEQIGVPLLSRGGRGVTISDAGEQAAPHLEEVVARWRMARRTEKTPLRELTVSAPSWLGTLFVPRIAAAVARLRLRFLEMPPPLIRGLIGQNHFDIALALGEGPLPHSWAALAVGELRKALFASPALARRLGAQPVAVARLREVPFITPIHSFNGQFVPADDGCPLPFAERRLGHEVQTLLLALEMAARTEQLVFGPAAVARPYLDRGLLREVPVQGWSVSEPLLLLCNVHRVLARDQREIAAVLRSAAAEVNV